MEIDIDLYSPSNKENGLRKRSSNGSSNPNRTCLTDITHKFVEKKENKISYQNIGLFKLALGNQCGNGALGKKCYDWRIRS